MTYNFTCHLPQSFWYKCKRNITVRSILSNRLWSRFSSLSCIHVRMNVIVNTIPCHTLGPLCRFPSANICQFWLCYVKFCWRRGPGYASSRHAMENLNTIHIHTATYIYDVAKGGANILQRNLNPNCNHFIYRMMSQERTMAFSGIKARLHRAA